MLSADGLQMVIAFFVLSGFFIAYSFDKNKQNLFSDFYIGRVIRIYFPFIASVFLGLAVLYLISLFSPTVYHIQNNNEFNERLIAAYHDSTIEKF